VAKGKIGLLGTAISKNIRLLYFFRDVKLNDINHHVTGSIDTSALLPKAHLFGKILQRTWLS